MATNNNQLPPDEPVPTKQCKGCNLTGTTVISTSKSANNPGRKFFKCTSSGCPKSFGGWFSGGGTPHAQTTLNWGATNTAPQPTFNLVPQQHFANAYPVAPAPATIPTYTNIVPNPAQPNKVIEKIDGLSENLKSILQVQAQQSTQLNQLISNAIEQSAKVNRIFEVYTQQDNGLQQAYESIKTDLDNKM